MLLATALLTLGMTIGACGDDSEEVGAGDGSTASGTVPGSDNGAQVVELGTLNDSGVTGQATLTRDGDTLKVKIEAGGLVADEEHPQHIHRPDGDTAGTCPSESADKDGDGTISIDEGAPFYGPVRAELTPFPSADGQGTIVYEESVTIDSDVEPLEDGVIVLHGTKDGEEYVPETPVACGVITPPGEKTETGTETDPGEGPARGIDTAPVETGPGQEQSE
ncbi:MAG: hypothetical protein ACR2NA_11860 [Solirubrobacterales bacterium]